MQSLHGDAARSRYDPSRAVERAKTGYVGAASLAVTRRRPPVTWPTLATSWRRRSPLVISFISFHKLPAWRVIWADPECAAMLAQFRLMQRPA